MRILQYEFERAEELVSEKPRKFRLTEENVGLIPKKVAAYLQAGGRFHQ